MALNMNTATLNEGAVAKDEFITNVHAKSGLLQLVNVEQITYRGQTFPIVPRTNVEEVGETNLAPYTDNAVTSLVAQPITLKTTVAVSKQLMSNHQGIINEISAQGATDVAELLDAKSAGLVPVVGANFGQLSNCTNASQLLTREDWYSALAMVTANYSTPTGFFMSRSLWAKLSGLVTPQGFPVFKMTGDIYNGTFEGMQYSTFNSTQEVGYVGDFAGKAKAGSVYEIEFDINPYGNIGEGANAINVWSRSMVACRIEGDFAFNFIPSAFVKLTSAPVSGS